MHVVATLPLYPPASRVGAWLSTHECLAHLARRGHRVDVVTHMDNKRCVHEGVTVHPVGSSLGSHDVSLVHLGDMSSAVKRVMAMAANRRRPVVQMIHGPATSQELDRRPTALAVFSSEAVRASSGWHGNSLVVSLPADLSKHRTTPGDRFTLVNLSELKGGRLFWQLAACMPDRRFLGVKGGWGRQVKGDLPNVTLAPMTDDMRSVWSDTRVLLMPSERETWGRVGLEAAASGIPTIAHPCDGILESLGDSAIYVDRDNAAGWVKQINRLSIPAYWRTASEKALARAEAFDPLPGLDAFADAMEALT